MSRVSYLFTSESVSEGHPDKVCDRISDTVVDAYLRALPEARVACETLATTNRVVVAGEVRGPDSITPEKIEGMVREAIRDIGYEQDGFHWKHVEIEILLHSQSADIAQGVDAAGNKDEGAGDQGIMFGYACRETPELMPAPLYYAHGILKRMAEARHSGETHMLGPDAKSQVTVAVQGRQADRRDVDRRVDAAPRRGPYLTRRARDRGALMCASRCQTAGSPTRPNGTSTRPASS